MRNYKQAIYTYSECTSLEYTESKIFLRIGQCHKKLKNFEKAAENIEIAVKIEEGMSNDS